MHVKTLTFFFLPMKTMFWFVLTKELKIIWVLSCWIVVGEGGIVSWCKRVYFTESRLMALCLALSLTYSHARTHTHTPNSLYLTSLSVSNFDIVLQHAADGASDVIQWCFWGRRLQQLWTHRLLWMVSEPVLVVFPSCTAVEPAAGKWHYSGNPQKSQIPWETSPILKSLETLFIDLSCD